MLVQILLSGSNILLDKCEMTAKIHFHACDLHMFSVCWYEWCQQLLTFNTQLILFQPTVPLAAVLGRRKQKSITNSY